MDRKTSVLAEAGRHDLLISRAFDLPVELLFKAYTEPGIVEEWMGTKVLELESRQHGSYRFETTDPEGNIVFKAHGVIHEFRPGEKITRTFEIVNRPFPIQLEFLDFLKITDDTSQLNIHIIYRSVAERDLVLQLPFAHGLNMAHNRLQQVADKLKQNHHGK